MMLIDGEIDVPANCKQCVLAIGNFDGVHRGHQEILSFARAEAEKIGAPVGVITFEPHPRTFFHPDQPVFRLTPGPLKARLLSAAGADFVCSLDFDAKLAAHEAEDFIQAQIIDRLAARHVVMGYDFHFGKGRKGNAELMSVAGEAAGFTVTIVEQVTDDDGMAPFSSSSIREALRQGEVKDAAGQLGYWWTVQGIVEKGDKRGRVIGFPTVNIHLEGNEHPANAIYACRVRDEATGETWRGAGYVGDRPTFDRHDVVLEVHLLNHTGDLYGRELMVEFIDYVRPDKKYDNVTELVEQMKADCQRIDQILADIEKDDPMRDYPLGFAVSENRL